MKQKNKNKRDLIIKEIGLWIFIYLSLFSLGIGIINYSILNAIYNLNLFTRLILICGSTSIPIMILFSFIAEGVTSIMEKLKK